MGLSPDMPPELIQPVASDENHLPERSSGVKSQLMRFNLKTNTNGTFWLNMRQK